MTTRFATMADIPDLVVLLEAFGREARVGFRTAHNQDRARLAHLVQAWCLDHYVRVAVSDGQIRGVIIAERGQDFWDPERCLLQERVWYVVPEYRGTRLSARLWQAWQQDSDHYLQGRRVDMVMMSTQGTATDFDPGRRGWRMIEQTWIKE